MYDNPIDNADYAMTDLLNYLMREVSDLEGQINDIRRKDNRVIGWTVVIQHLLEAETLLSKTAWELRKAEMSVLDYLASQEKENEE
jgi:hypothetical protein